MKKRNVPVLAAGLVLATTPCALAQDSVAKFYKDKTIRVIVSSEPGGGYDNYGRMFAKHMPRFIPGNPTMIVQNMPGGGGLTAANYIYNVAPKDGTVIGQVQRNVPFVAIQGQPGPQFDPTKFNWIGSMNNEVNTCVALVSTNVKTIEEAKQKIVIMGGSGPNDTEQTPAVLNNVLGTKFKIISGYPSSSAVTLAVERGEVDGICSSYSSLITRNGSWFKEKKVNVLVQNSGKKHPDLAKVPLSSELAKNKEDRQLLELNDARLVVGRPFLAGPGVPEDRIKALRKAFDDMVKDKEFLADVEKAKMELAAVGGDEVQELIERVAATPKAIIDRLNDAQVYKGERLMAKVEEAGTKGTIADLPDGARKIVLKLDGGKTFTAGVSGSRTKIKIDGKDGAREALKVGMACAVAAAGDGQEASSIDCK
jgi:tripartite-type tricarboxylate transporter receptor subunit TctC